MFKKTWKGYGAEGHRQRESFFESYTHDFSDDKVGTRIITVENSDVTGTDMYSLISIIRNTEAECDEELDGQISDGIFENSIVEAVVCIFSGEIAEESGEIAEESLGRNIYFHLIMQSYMQLENIYGEIAEESLEKKTDAEIEEIEL